VPTSRRLDTRPCMVILPSVGSVMRARIFRSVLLPAPFLPMMPTTSPSSISKDTVFECPEGVVVILFEEGERGFNCACYAVLQGFIGSVHAYLVLLRQALDFDH
jgi:hypothetical protein